MSSDFKNVNYSRGPDQRPEALESEVEAINARFRGEVPDQSPFPCQTGGDNQTPFRQTVGNRVCSILYAP